MKGSDMKKLRSYKDYLRLKGIKPMRIIHTQKNPGDVIIHWCKSAEVAR
jgi:hypothetical protein